MDRLVGLRGPLAAASLVALSVVALARVGLGLSELGAGGSTAVAAARLAPNGSDGALTVLVGLLVASCFAAPAVPARRRFAAWGVVLAAVSLLATVLALALTDLAVAGWSLVWSLPDVVVPVVVGLALLALVRAPAAAADAEVASPVPEPVESPAEPPPDPELAPAWPQDTASGAVWRTAGEAASGAPALGWDPTSSGSWPLPAPPALPAPSAPAALPATRADESSTSDQA